MYTRRFITLSALAILMTVTACVQEQYNEDFPVPTGPEIVANEDNLFEPGVMNVKFSEEMAAIIEEGTHDESARTRSAELNTLMEDMGIISMERIFPDAGEYEIRTRREGMHRWYRVTYAAHMPRTKAVDGLIAMDDVEIAEPVRKIKVADTFNDLGNDMWGLYNASYKGFDINVSKVWENCTVGDSRVVVSVVDQGVDINHEDLKANCLPTGHYNALNGGYNIEPCPHGTHVAGTIAAVSNNGVGIAGIAGGDYANGIPGVSILSCQIFDANGNGGSAAAAIKWGADNGALISQNSWGYIADRNGDGVVSGTELDYAKTLSVDAPTKEAIDYFVKYAGCDNDGNQLPNSLMKGGVVIFAAGNDGIEYGAPANYPPVIAVGAINKNGSRPAFSNYGNWVDICAPGVDIKSTVPGGYEQMQGTSMACPHVSGVAALVVSYCGGQGFTAGLLKEKLLSSANTTKIPSYYKIGGLVDALAAIYYGTDTYPGEVADLVGSASSNNIDITCTVTADSEGSPNYGYLVLYGKDKGAVEVADPKSRDGVESVTFDNQTAVGETATFSLSGLEFNKEYHFKVYAYNFGMNYSAASEVLTVRTGGNSAPEIVFDYDQDCVLSAWQTVNVPIVVNEPDGHEFALEHIEGSDAEYLMTLPDGGFRLVIMASEAEAGDYSATFKATDIYGLSTEASFNYTILPNRAPMVIKEMEDIIMFSKGQEFLIDMNEYIQDPDGEVLKYEVVVSNNKAVFAQVRGEELIGTTLGYGTSEVKVVGTDVRDEKCELTFNVVVKDPSEPLSLYPNPVRDYLYVGTLEVKETSIVIVNASGNVVHESVSQVGAVEPAKIDMTKCAPGVYGVTVSFDGKEYRQDIVKI